MMQASRLGAFRAQKTKNSPSQSPKFFKQTLRFSSQFIYSTNVSTLATLEKFEKDTSKSIVSKAEKAKNAQAKWEKYPLDVRISHLEKFVSAFAQQTNELATTLSSETGKPISQARNEVKGSIKRFEYFISNAYRVLEEHSQPLLSDASVVEKLAYEPIGVIGNISAWNYPFFVGCANVVFPALLTGNAVLYKPSEYSLSTGYKFVTLFNETLPDSDLVQFIAGDGEVGSELITSSYPNGERVIDAIYFTGSKNTGIKIATEAGKRLMKVQVELGGKDGIYVAEDVDVAKVAAAVADGAFYNNGQSCCSVERVYVNSKIYSEFVQEVVKEVQAFKMGDPYESSTYLGPLTRPQHAQTLLAQVQDAQKKGAKVLLGGKETKIAHSKGTYFEPTVITDVNHTMEVMKEETFGPIIPIQSVQDDEEAVELLNDCQYGLTNGVYTKSKERAIPILKQLNSGSVYWNSCDRVSPALPWTGRKGSGIGSTLGDEGLRAFVQPKAYHLNTTFF